MIDLIFAILCFNTQPPEGGCVFSYLGKSYLSVVSTHSHPKVAAVIPSALTPLCDVSTHSHPKVAAQYFGARINGVESFNTQPPEGGCR